MTNCDIPLAYSDVTKDNTTDENTHQECEVSVHTVNYYLPQQEPVALFLAAVLSDQHYFSSQLGPLELIPKNWTTPKLALVMRDF